MSSAAPQPQASLHVALGDGVRRRAVCAVAAAAIVSALLPGVANAADLAAAPAAPASVTSASPAPQTTPAPPAASTATPTPQATVLQVSVPAPASATPSPAAPATPSLQAPTAPSAPTTPAVPAPSVPAPKVTPPAVVEKTVATVERTVERVQQAPALVEKTVEQAPPLVERTVEQAKQAPAVVEKTLAPAKQAPALVEKTLEPVKNAPALVETAVESAERVLAPVTTTARPAAATAAQALNTLGETVTPIVQAPVVGAVVQRAGPAAMSGARVARPSSSRPASARTDDSSPAMIGGSDSGQGGGQSPATVVGAPVVGAVDALLGAATPLQSLGSPTAVGPLSAVGHVVQVLQRGRAIAFHPVESPDLLTGSSPGMLAVQRTIAENAVHALSGLPDLPLASLQTTLVAAAASAAGSGYEIPAALLAALILVAPRLGRRLRLTPDLRRPPLYLPALENPG
jgi:hypothetical protein